MGKFKPPVVGTHWVRYGIAGDQKYLLPPFSETFDLLVVNANMVAHMPSALSQFLSQRLKKPFVVDPQTHAFQHDIDHLLSNSRKSSGTLKRSWKSLIEQYGEPLIKVIGSNHPRSLRPEDLDDSKLVHDFCRRVLLFQRNYITSEIEEGPDAEYLRFLVQETGENVGQTPPVMLIAPYFFVSGPFQDEWLAINRRLIASSRKIIEEEKLKEPLAAQLVISKEVLSDRNLRKGVVEAFLENNPKVILLWVDDFSEQSASRVQLEKFVDLVSALGEGGSTVVNLYGGFFSVVQARLGKLKGKLAAVCHGLEYGESKPVIPVTGGIPVSRFYSNSLHHRLASRFAYTEVRALGGLKSVADFHTNVCDCSECKKVIRDDPKINFLEYIDSQSKSVLRSGRRTTMEFPTASASDHCTRHYMWCKEREYRNDLTIDGLKRELLRAFNVLSPQIGPEFSAHAKIWSEIL